MLAIVVVFTSDFFLFVVFLVFNDEFSSEMLVFEFFVPSSDFLNVGFALVDCDES